MSTTDYRQPSDLKDFHRISGSDEERYNINPVGTSAEQIVHISFNKSLRKNLTISHFNYSYARLLVELR